LRLKYPTSALSKEYTVGPLASKARKSKAVHPRITEVIGPTSKAALAKKAKTPEKLPYEKGEDYVIATSKAEVKQFFDKLKEERKCG